MHQDPKDLYEVEEPSKCLSFLRLLWKFCRCIFSHVTLVSLVVAYCVLGAYAFESIEADHEIQVKESIKYVRSNVTKRIWSLTENSPVLRQENWTDKVVEELVKFEADLLDKMKKDGWDGSEELKNMQWTFAGALFYSIIVITTIGYGHIAPKTQNGKVVTIFYAILGIPLMLLCLSNIGKVMASSFRFLYWKICCYVCTRPPKPRRHHRHPSAFVRSHSLRQPGRYASGRSTNLGASSYCRTLRTVGQRSVDSTVPASAFPENGEQFSRPDNECNNGRRNRYEATARYWPSRYSAPTRNDGVAQPAVSASAVPLSLKSRTDNSTNSSSRAYRAGAKYPAATRSLDRKYRPIPLGNDAARTPVLFNKYAIDERDVGERRSMAPVADRVQSSARRCRSVEASVDLEMLRSTSLKRPIRNNARSWNNRRETPFARPMGPPGAPRQFYVDNLDLEYDYSANAGFGNGDNEADDPTDTKPVPIWLCVFLVVGYILAGAFLFAEWETWPYLDSAYFCFITLTTIGFGDLVPAHRLNAHQGIALCSLYLLFGIALLVMSFNLVQEEVISNVKSVAKKLGIIKDDEDNGGAVIDIDDIVYEDEDDYEIDVYPDFAREDPSRRRCYSSANDTSPDVYCGGAGDDFSGVKGSSVQRNYYHPRDRSPMPSRFTSR